MNRIIPRISTYCLLVAAAVMLSSQASAYDSNYYEFHAQYNKVFDGINYPHIGAKSEVVISRMSGDGRILAFYAYVRNPTTGADERFIYIMNFDGSEFTKVELPTNPDTGQQVRARDIAISHYGDKIYFVTQQIDNRIYLIESADVIEVLNTDEYDQFGLVPDSEQILRTTYSGDFVYFLEGRIGGVNDTDLWRVSATTAPELVVDDLNVSNSGADGRRIIEYDVSSTSGFLALVLLGNSNGIKNEVFAGPNAANLIQLTDDSEGKVNLVLSDDGSTISYVALTPSRRLLTMDYDGSNPRELAPLGQNLAGPAITANGDTIFYNDTLAEGGRIIASNGRGHYPLFPGSDIDLAATDDPQISADSSRVSFANTYQLYSGRFNAYAGPVAPTIENVQFDPPFIGDQPDDKVIILTTKITDPQDNADVARVSLDYIEDGNFVTSSQDLPLWFDSVPLDDGTGVDVVAGDHIYSTASQATGGADTSYMTVRLGAEDIDGNVTVVDKLLGTPTSGCSSDTGETTFSLTLDSGEPLFCVSALQVHMEDIVVSNLSHLGVIGQSIGLTSGGTISVAKGSSMSFSIR